jgi:hypothetical protein
LAKVCWVAAVLAGLILLAGCSEREETLSDQERQEIANTLRGFIKAFAGGDTETLETYWSRECTVEDRLRHARASMLNASLFGIDRGGVFSVSIDDSKLSIEGTDEHATVPLDQPEGAVAAVLTINGEAVPLMQPLVFEVPIRFAREEGTWKVTSCVLFINDEDEDESSTTGLSWQAAEARETCTPLTPDPRLPPELAPAQVCTGAVIVSSELLGCHSPGIESTAPPTGLEPTPLPCTPSPGEFKLTGSGNACVPVFSTPPTPFECVTVTPTPEVPVP